MAYIKQYGGKSPMMIREDFSAQALCPKGAIMKNWPAYSAPLNAGARPDLFTGVQSTMNSNMSNLKKSFKVTQT